MVGPVRKAGDDGVLGSQTGGLTVGIRGSSADQLHGRSFPAEPIHGLVSLGRACYLGVRESASLGGPVRVLASLGLRQGASTTGRLAVYDSLVEPVGGIRALALGFFVRVVVASAGSVGVGALRVRAPGVAGVGDSPGSVLVLELGRLLFLLFFLAVGGIRFDVLGRPATRSGHLGVGAITSASAPPLPKRVAESGRRVRDGMGVPTAAAASGRNPVFLSVKTSR